MPSSDGNHKAKFRGGLSQHLTEERIAILTGLNAGGLKVLSS